MPLECGTGQRLILTNVTYEQQGQYICLASNKINGNVREVKSDPVSLQVVGAPRVRRRRRLRNVEKVSSQIRITGAPRARRGRIARVSLAAVYRREKIYRFITLRDSGSLNISGRGNGISASISVALSVTRPRVRTYNIAGEIGEMQDSARRGNVANAY